MRLGQGPNGKPCISTGIQRLPQFSRADPSERFKHTDNFWSSLEE